MAGTTAARAQRWLAAVAANPRAPAGDLAALDRAVAARAAANPLACFGESLEGVRMFEDDPYEVLDVRRLGLAARVLDNLRTLGLQMRVDAFGPPAWAPGGTFGRPLRELLRTGEPGEDIRSRRVFDALVFLRTHGGPGEYATFQWALERALAGGGGASAEPLWLGISRVVLGMDDLLDEAERGPAGGAAPRFRRWTAAHEAAATALARYQRLGDMRPEFPLDPRPFRNAADAQARYDAKLAAAAGLYEGPGGFGRAEARTPGASVGEPEEG